MTQLKLDFKVDRVKLGITQETVQVRDQGLFDFEIRSITTGAVVKDHENEFNFKIEEKQQYQPMFFYMEKSC